MAQRNNPVSDIYSSFATVTSVLFDDITRVGDSATAGGGIIVPNNKVDHPGDQDGNLASTHNWLSRDGIDIATRAGLTATQAEQLVSQIKKHLAAVVPETSHQSLCGLLWDGEVAEQILVQQLAFNGIVQALALLSSGFSSHLTHKEFREKYKLLFWKALNQSYEVQNAITMLLSLVQPDPTEFWIGHSMVFLTKGTLERLDTLKRLDALLLAKLEHQLDEEQKRKRQLPQGDRVREEEQHRVATAMKQQNVQSKRLIALEQQVLDLEREYQHLLQSRDEEARQQAIGVEQQPALAKRLTDDFKEQERKIVDLVAQLKQQRLEDAQDQAVELAIQLDVERRRVATLEERLCDSAKDREVERESSRVLEVNKQLIVDLEERLRRSVDDRQIALELERESSRELAVKNRLIDDLEKRHLRSVEGRKVALELLRESSRELEVKNLHIVNLQKHFGQIAMHARRITESYNTRGAVTRSLANDMSAINAISRKVLEDAKLR